MNGAKAEPFAKTSRPPKSNKNMTIGASHHFLRTRKKSQNSLMIENLFTDLLAFELHPPTGGQ